MRRSPAGLVVVTAAACLAFPWAAAPVHAAPVTYDFVGYNFNGCGYGCGPFSPQPDDPDNAPANWASDHILASFTLDAPLVPNQHIDDVQAYPGLVSWSIRDALGYVSLASANGDALTNFSVSADASGAIEHYMMAVLLPDDGAGNEIGILKPALYCGEECFPDLVYFAAGLTLDGLGPHEWDAFLAGFDNPDVSPGQWTQRAAVPEPATVALTGLGVAGLLAIRRRRSLSRR